MVTLTWAVHRPECLSFVYAQSVSRRDEDMLAPPLNSGNTEFTQNFERNLCTYVEYFLIISTVFGSCHLFHVFSVKSLINLSYSFFGIIFELMVLCVSIARICLQEVSDVCALYRGSSGRRCFAVP